jgi:iron complex outermembrane receptor protein
VELEARQQVTDQFRIQASYTYTDVEYEKSDDDTQGNTANAVPEQMASVWGHYDFTSGPLQGLDVGAGVRYTGESYVDEANTDKVPDYTLVDAALHYDLGELGLNGAEARLNVNNLLDKDYVAACYSAARCYISYQF